MSPKQYKTSLEEKLQSFDKEGAATVCNDLIRLLYGSTESFDQGIGKEILQLLRSKRMFGLMQKVSDALIFTGRHSLRIYRQYAQSLIDSGDYSAALAVLNDLRNDSKNALAASDEAKTESIEAEGLVGRLYKQLYVNAAKAGSYNGQFLRQSLQCYYTVYTSDPRTYLWHGINVVALLQRAEKDGIAIEGYPSYRLLAENILARVEEKKSDDKVVIWDYATAAEACIALGQLKDAQQWVTMYAGEEKCEAFELASALRQYEELWDLGSSDEHGKNILSLIRSALLKREGGKVIIEAAEILALKNDNPSLEKNFGDNVYIDFKSYKTGYARCESVARIGRLTQRGDGTGFLLKKKVFDPRAADDELVLVTNAHVINTDPSIRAAMGALDPAEAIIIFEALDREQEFRVGSVLFSSSPMELDATVVSFKEDQLERLKKLTAQINFYEVSTVLPLANGDAKSDPRLYVIGHPKGGSLHFSMQDNLLLDTENPRIHYRTPTEPGNSGSPVFNQQWELVALHHAGKKDMKKLNKKDGTYEANEGIWMKAIIEKYQANIS